MMKLKKINEYDNSNWEKKIDKAALAYNLSFHRAIDTTPFHLKYGHAHEFDVDKQLGIPKHSIPIQQLINKRDEKFEKYAEKHIKRGKREIKKEWKPNESVLIYKEKLGNKLGTNWQDGFKIRRKLGPDSYEVIKGNQIWRLNKKHIRSVNVIEGGNVVYTPYKI